MDNKTDSFSTIKQKRQASLPEFFTYALYFVGQNVIYWLVTSFLMYYYTDEIMLSPATVAVIFGIAKVWDAINDPIFGVIVDKTKFKSGRFIPWLKAGSFLLPLSTVLVFSIPADIATWLKIVLAFVTYAIWDILYTVSDAPAFALSTVMTDNVQERSSLITMNRVGGALGALVLNIVAPLMIEMSGAARTALILCSIALVTMVPLGFTAKERTNPVENIDTEESSFKEMWTYLKGNKYLLYFYVSFIIHNTFKVTLGTYVAEHLLGGLGIMTKIMLFSVPIMLLIYISIPILTKKVDKMLIYKTSVVITIVMGVIMYFIGYENVNRYIAISIVKGFFEGFSGVLMFTFSADALEYGHFKTGLRKEGITFSLQTFSAKLTSALASVLSAFLLSIIGYSAGVKVTGSIASWLWAANCFLPSLGALLSLPFLFRYTLNDKDVQVMANINNGDITREEGDKLLSKPY